MRNIALTIILGFSLFSSAFGQPGKAEVRVDDYLKIANDLIFQSSYYNAIEYLEKAQAIRPEDPNIWYRLADAQVLSRNYEAAVKCFEKVLNAKDESIFLSFPLIRFEYGDALMRVGDYRRAVVQFQGFLDNYRGNKVAYYREWANRKLDGCYLGMNPEDKSEFFEVANLGAEVNSPYTNYAPRALANDYLMYSSLRSAERITANEQAAKSKVYLSQKVDGAWSTPTVFTGPTRSANEHIGHGAYSQDGQRFYFTRCPQQENYQVLCNIFYSEYRNGIWTTPKSLRLINDKKAQSTTPHIVLLKNGIERIYFSSDREGSLGGMDIWSVDRDLE
ncbi:MAG: tetratricopeptide repeat protein, partial [Bacteroidota bacterium]